MAAWRGSSFPVCQTVSVVRTIKTSEMSVCLITHGITKNSLERGLSKFIMGKTISG